MDFDKAKILIHKYDEYKKIHTNLVNVVDKMQQECITYENVKTFLMEFSKDTRAIIKDKLESLANSALKCVFIEKDVCFRIIPNPTKRIMQYDLYVTTDGVLTPLEDAKGGGILDVITIALRISFVKMFSALLRQTIIFDEPFKNMDSTHLPLAVDWMKEIANEFDMQFIVVTHIEDMISKSNKVIKFVNHNGVTKIE